MKWRAHMEYFSVASYIQSSMVFGTNGAGLCQVDLKILGTIPARKKRVYQHSNAG